MWDNLPPEIWTEILSRLPVKLALRFRSVCKTWYSLISSPNFIAQTLDRSTTDRVLVHRLSIHGHSFRLHDESFVESHEHPDVPDLLRRPGVRIIGSCDGLICFTKHSSQGPLETILIWNPSIRKLVQLPLPPRLPKTYSHKWGFGFDSESRDYKVVRIVYHGSGDEFVAEIDIFDLRKGVWRSLSSPMRSGLSRQHSVYLHGNLHWAASKYNLKSFNLSTEVLQEMEVVTDTVHPTVVCPRLFLINGLLSVALESKKQQGGAHQWYSVWSMKEYGVTESWTKLFNIELQHTMPSVKLVKSNWLRFWENGQVLLVDHREFGDFLVLYNLESRKSKALPSTNGAIIYACFYKESLVLL